MNSSNDCKFAPTIAFYVAYTDLPRTSKPEYCAFVLVCPRGCCLRVLLVLVVLRNLSRLTVRCHFPFSCSTAQCLGVAIPKMRQPYN